MDHTTWDHRLRSYSSIAHTLDIVFFACKAGNGTSIVVVRHDKRPIVVASNAKIELNYMNMRYIKHACNLRIHISNALPDTVVIANTNKNKNAEDEPANGKIVVEDFSEP